jgi:hypothetical protein
MAAWWDVGGKWDDESYDREQEADDDLGFYGFVLLLAVLTMVVSFLAVT